MVSVNFCLNAVQKVVPQTHTRANNQPTTRSPQSAAMFIILTVCTALEFRSIVHSNNWIVLRSCSWTTEDESETQSPASHSSMSSSSPPSSFAMVATITVLCLFPVPVWWWMNCRQNVFGWTRFRSTLWAGGSMWNTEGVWKHQHSGWWVIGWVVGWLTDLCWTDWFWWTTSTGKMIIIKFWKFNGSYILNEELN